MKYYFVYSKEDRISQKEANKFWNKFFAGIVFLMILAGACNYYEWYITGLVICGVALTLLVGVIILVLMRLTGSL